MRPRLNSAARIALAAIACGLVTTAAAQGYPARPVRVLTPAPPGGSTDLLARVVSVRLTEQLGQQFIVDNRPGASGVVAAELLARAAPDGYTLGVAYTTHTTLATLTKLPYDPVASFAPVTLMTSAPLVLVVNPGLPAKSVRELVELAKKRPLNYGSAGNGSGGHLAGELFKLMAGIDAQHIPYKGAGPAATDLVAGNIQYQFGAQITVQGFVKAGRLRALAVTSAKRAASLPELPTVAEALPGFEVINWFGVLAPAKTPAALVARLNAEIARALAHPDVREKLAAEGSEIVASSPVAFGQFLRDDIPKWARVVRATGMRLD